MGAKAKDFKNDFSSLKRKNEKLLRDNLKGRRAALRDFVKKKHNEFEPLVEKNGLSL